MQSFVAQARRVGDQIVITIPREAVAAEQLCADMFVKVSVERVRQQAPAKKSDESLGPDDPWKLLE
jgi:hypothetical protein